MAKSSSSSSASVQRRKSRRVGRRCKPEPTAAELDELCRLRAKRSMRRLTGVVHLTQEESRRLAQLEGKVRRHHWRESKRRHRIRVSFEEAETETDFSDTDTDEQTTEDEDEPGEHAEQHAAAADHDDEHSEADTEIVDYGHFERDIIEGKQEAQLIDLTCDDEFEQELLFEQDADEPLVAAQPAVSEPPRAPSPPPPRAPSPPPPRAVTPPPVVEEPTFSQPLTLVSTRVGPSCSGLMASFLTDHEMTLRPRPRSMIEHQQQYCAVLESSNESEIWQAAAAVSYLKAFTKLPSDEAKRNDPGLDYAVYERTDRYVDLRERGVVACMKDVIYQRSGAVIAEGECAICGDEMLHTVGRLLPCRHYFHLRCVDRWLLCDRGECPVCRHRFPLVAEHITIGDLELMGRDLNLPGGLPHELAQQEWEDILAEAQEESDDSDDEDYVEP